MSTDSAWCSDSFVPKGCAEGVFNAGQLQPGLLLAQGGAPAVDWLVTCQLKGAWKQPN